MKSVSCMTEPAMELLEQHKTALEKQLASVKKDVTAVVDQYEKEQVLAKEMEDKYEKQMEMNKSLV